MTFYNSKSLQSTNILSGQKLGNSVRLRSSSDGYLSRTNTATPTSTTVWTCSFWVKRGSISANRYIFNAGPWNGGDDFEGFYFMSNDTLRVQLTIGNTQIADYRTNAVFRDVSSWYHFVIVRDGQSYIVYVNGVSQTFSLNSFTSNSTSWINSANDHRFGNRLDSGQDIDGYLAEIHVIDGQALTANDFGETHPTYGTWRPKRYNGTYGTNGFHLPMRPTTQAEGFNTVLYTGTSADQSITNVGFAPDLVWTKSRDNAYNYNMYDSVRGAQISIQSSSGTANLVGYPRSLYSFDSDGFRLGNQDNSNYTSGSDAVAWCWDAGSNQASTGHSSVLYEGSSTTPNSVKGFGFSPDLVWIKNRLAANYHYIYDSVRGANKSLTSNATSAEDAYSIQLDSFDEDGFTVPADTAGYNNYAGRRYIAWGWDAGDDEPSTNNLGSIETTVKASDATGFSIVSYTVPSVGSTSFSFGHGLSTAPSVVISKARTAATGWITYHSSVGTGKYLQLNSTNAEVTEANSYSAVSSTTVTGGTDTWWGVGQDYISYCFSEVSGVSKFGTYSGTGTTGNSVTGLGFKPGFIIVKRTDAAEGWQMLDSTRNPFAPHNSVLEANQANAEITNSSRDTTFDSDGFTINNTSNAMNASGGTYIYMAFKGSYSDHVAPLNDTGTIDSRVKANTEKGFSIVRYTGNGTGGTVGHGLSSTPELMFAKRVDSGPVNWVTYDSTSGATKYMNLNASSAAATLTSVWNDTEPTSSVFTVGTSGATNISGADQITYCFHSVAGYSKIGSYTGTGSAGNSITGLGFKPAWLMIKETTSTGNWAIIDNTRSPDDQVQGDYVWANLTDAEAGASAPLTFDSDGFTINSSDSDTNTSSQTYIYMAFADTRDDQWNFDDSGNKNNWEPNNINSNAPTEPSYDIMDDVPTMSGYDKSNYATWNPLYRNGGGVSSMYAYPTFSNANLTVSVPTNSYATSTMKTVGGKIYAETNLDTKTLENSWGFIWADNFDQTSITLGSSYKWAGYYHEYAPADVRWYDEGTQQAATNITLANNDTLQWALDVNEGKAWLGINNNWYDSSGTTTGDPSTGSNPTFTLTYEEASNLRLFVGNGASTAAYSANFGQRPFKYTPPSGFKKLNVANLPSPKIKDGSKYFNTVLYSGDGTNDRAITGVGFQPDFTWLKARNDVADHTLFDVVRGAGSDKALYTNGTYAEGAYTAGFDAFLSDGFQVDNNVYTNSSSNTYVAWNWKAGGSAVTNTDGDITSTVSANPTSGFSIVTGTYTGVSSTQTFGHGLGATPAMIITKDKSTTANFGIWHKSFGNTSGNTPIMIFNTNALIASGNYMGTVSSTLSSVSNGLVVNGNDFVQWIWTEIEGFSAFGSYTGNGSTDGAFIYTGFRPAWVLIRRTDTTDNWNIQDSARTSYNWSCNALFANLANAESTAELESTYGRDYLSNGIKIRASHTSHNASGGNYIYAAFAENPFKYSNAR